MRKWPNRVGKLASAILRTCVAMGINLGATKLPRVTFIIMTEYGRGSKLMVPQHLVILLLKLAVSAALASILTRSSGFLRMLMREERTVPQRVLMALVCSLFFGAGVAARVFTRNAYSAVDLGLEA